MLSEAQELQVVPSDKFVKRSIDSLNKAKNKWDICKVLIVVLRI